MRVFFLGSGASAAFEGLPTMSNFFLKRDFEKSTKWLELDLFIKENKEIFENNNSNSNDDKESNCLNINLEKVFTYLSIASNPPAKSYFSSDASAWFSDKRYGSDERIQEIMKSLRESKFKLPYSRSFKHFTDSINYQLNEYINYRLSSRDPKRSNKRINKFLCSLKPDDSIITTNYDVLLDQKLKEIKVQYTKEEESDRLRGKKLNDEEQNDKKGKQQLIDMWDRSNNILDSNTTTWRSGIVETSLKKEENKGVYLKLHGSLNWRVCPNIQCPNHSIIANISRFDFKHDDADEPGEFCRRCGSILKQVIVPPTFYKSIDEYPRLGYVWDIAFKKMLQADEIVFYGFSFAESDLPVLWLIREGVYGKYSKDFINASQTSKSYNQFKINSNTSVDKMSIESSEDFALPRISIIDERSEKVRDKVKNLLSKWQSSHRKIKTYKHLKNFSSKSK